jgi:hypothetical protein
MVVQTTQTADPEALEGRLEATWEWDRRSEAGSGTSRGEEKVKLLKP